MKWIPGHISLMFRIYIFGEFLWLWIHCSSSNHYKFLHMPRHLCCRGMCKIYSSCFIQIGMKFPSNLKSDWNIFSETMSQGSWCCNGKIQLGKDPRNHTLTVNHSREISDWTFVRQKFDWLMKLEILPSCHRRPCWNASVSTGDTCHWWHMLPHFLLPVWI